MANYLSLPAHKGTSLDPEDGLVIERSTGGALRGRSFYTSRKTTINLIHDMLKRTQVYGGTSTIMGFYDAWKAGTSPFTAALEPFTLSLDSISYSVVFVGPPKIEMIDYDIYKVLVSLAEV